MDSKEYLNQLSTTIRPEKKNLKSKILSSKIAMVAIVGGLLFLLILLVGNIISGSVQGPKEQAIQLKLRLDSLSTIISDYQPGLKSSDLRSYTTSLDGVISNTNRDLSDYLKTKYNYSGKNDSYKTLADDETLYHDNLDAELFNAKINGILDRVYSHKMTYEIYTLLNMENKLYGATGDTSLKDILDSSYESLSTLYDKFDNFSETN